MHRNEALTFVGLGAAIWAACFMWYPHPFILVSAPNYGLLICMVASFLLQGGFPKWLIVGGCMCAGASIALGVMTVGSGGVGGLLPLLFGCLWAWYFSWGPGSYGSY